MALIIETGAIVDNANSYVDEDAIVAYASARGVTITTQNATIFGVEAMDYLSLFADKWKGTKIDPQDRIPDWPRDGVCINGVDLADDEIPARIKNAQMQLCIYRQQGITLVPTSNTEAFITREKIGPIETEYSAEIALQSGVMPDLPIVQAMLSPYLQGGGMVRTVRV